MFSFIGICCLHGVKPLTELPQHISNAIKSLDCVSHSREKLQHSNYLIRSGQTLRAGLPPCGLPGTGVQEVEVSDNRAE